MPSNGLRDLVAQHPSHLSRSGPQPNCNGFSHSCQFKLSHLFAVLKQKHRVGFKHLERINH